MRLMVFGKHQAWDFVYLAIKQCGKFLTKCALQIQFVREPHRHGGDKGSETTGSVAQVGLKQALELDQRFIVKDEMGQIRAADFRFRHAVSDRVRRKTRVVLSATKAFLLCRSDYRPITNDAGRTIVIVR